MTESFRYSLPEMRLFLRTRCAASRSVAACAHALGVSDTLLRNALKPNGRIGPKLARALGYRKDEATYSPLPTTEDRTDG